MNGNDGLAIDLHDVTKVYKGRVHALQGIEMRVRRGEVFGLLGPNGAGKSTLVKIMMSVVRPTHARGTVLGRPVAHKPTLARVGYLPENHRFPKYLTGRQILDLFGAMAKVDRPTRRRRAAELLDTVGMAGAADRKIVTYSKGMAQRIGLAQALINDPDLVVLDEPTDGVDPEGRRDIREVMNRLRGEGKTVFINSHLLSELEMISDRVAILVAGRVARQGTIDELTVAKQRYEIEVEPGADPLATRRAVLAAVRGTLAGVAAPPAPPAPGTPPPSAPPLNYAGPPPLLPASGAARLPVLRGALDDGTWAELEGTTLRVGADGAGAVQPIIDAFRAAGLVVRRVQPIRQSLEDLFMEAVADGGDRR
jgi:ABC-2 type transport system ATP-binding protein